MLKKIDNILLLGTSHVAHQSQKEIIEVIEKYNPEVVGIELDLGRFKNLMSDKKKKQKKPSFTQMIKNFGGSGAIFALIAGHVQKSVGKKLNIDPGIDMKTAYLEARKNTIPTALIDLDIKITLKKLSRLGFIKKVSMFTSLVFKSFKKDYRKKLQFDIKGGVPDENVVVDLINIVKKEVPDLHKILIEDRNQYMVRRLLKLRENHKGNILAVVGAGHVDGMYKILERKLSKTQNTISHTFKMELR